MSEHAPRTLKDIAIRHPDGFRDVLDAAEGAKLPISKPIRKALNDAKADRPRLFDEPGRSDIIINQDQILPQDWSGDYVYIIQSDPGIVKIGVSKNPIERTRQLNTGSSTILELKAAAGVTEPYFVEKWLHNELREFNTSGEWFDVEDISKVDELVGRIHGLARSSQFGSGGFVDE